MPPKYSRYTPFAEASRLQRFLRACVEQLYPQYCPICQTRLAPEEEGVCTTCLINLPPYYESFYKGKDRLLGGVYPIGNLFVGYLFEKGNDTQRLIHSIKYQYNRDLARYLGRLIARNNGLQNHSFDYIIPIPTSRKNEVLRGYNQTAVIAEGVGSIVHAPIAYHALKRISSQGSQTQRSRTERMQAMHNAFALGRDEIRPAAKLLLVDDVLTTGSTLLAAADQLSLTAPQSIDVLMLSVDA